LPRVLESRLDAWRFGPRAPGRSLLRRGPVPPSHPPIRPRTRRSARATSPPPTRS